MTSGWGLVALERVQASVNDGASACGIKADVFGRRVLIS